MAILGNYYGYGAEYMQARSPEGSVVQKYSNPGMMSDCAGEESYGLAHIRTNTLSRAAKLIAPVMEPDQARVLKPT